MSVKTVVIFLTIVASAYCQLYGASGNFGSSRTPQYQYNQAPYPSASAGRSAIGHNRFSPPYYQADYSYNRPTYYNFRPNRLDYNYNHHPERSPLHNSHGFHSHSGPDYYNNGYHHYNPLGNLGQQYLNYRQG